MSYKRVYYDEIWESAFESTEKCNEWLSDFERLSKRINEFVETDSYKGQAATNMKDYLRQVHGLLIAVIGAVVQSYEVNMIDYYRGYRDVVDCGDQSEYGLRYTTIVNDEVNETGPIQTNLNNITRLAEQVVEDVNSVKRSISDIVSITSCPKVNDLYEGIKAAKSTAQTVHNNALSFEESRKNDFVEIDRLISQALAIITAQLGERRMPIIEYQSGAFVNMCDMNQIDVDLETVAVKMNALMSSDSFKEVQGLIFNRKALMEEEEKEKEKESREWARWISVGLALVATAAITIATAGTATVATCVVIGAVSGGVTAAVDVVVDNYIETGHVIKGLDWEKLGEAVFVGVAGGAVSGYLGAISHGSKIMRPIDKAMTAFKHTAMKEVAEGIASVSWEVGEMVVDIGVAVTDDKPGTNIYSALKEGTGEIYDDVKNTIKDVAVEGVKSAVGGYVEGVFDADFSDKTGMRKVKEEIFKSGSEELAEGVINTGWYIGEAILDDDSSTTVKSALMKGGKETIQGLTSSATKAVVSEGLFAGVDDIDNKAGKVVGNIIKDTVTDTSEDVAGGVTGRIVDYVYGDEKDASKILGDIWEEDLQNGTKIGEHVAEAAGKNVGKEIVKDKKVYSELRKIDRIENGDGKIEVVQFNDYAVTKQDYDAAIENAGKGVYADKTVQDLLGLPKDTDISEGKQRTVSIEKTEKYTSNRKTTDTVTVGGKYTFRKSYFESSLNVAGTEEYKNKTAQEILEIPKDVDLSEINRNNRRVNNNDIGKGKEVDFHKDYSDKITKIHISNVKKENVKKKEEKIISK